jgi:hypothetical protein
MKWIVLPRSRLRICDGQHRYLLTLGLPALLQILFALGLVQKSHTIFARSSRFARRFANVFRARWLVASGQRERGFFLGCGCSEEELFPMGLRMMPRG